MFIQEIKIGSEDYKKALDIRDRVLRKPLGLEFTRAEYDADKNDTHFILKDGTAVAGTVTLKEIDDKILKLRQLAVEPKYQGRNIGSFLTRHCEDYAKQNGYVKIVLHARLTVVKFYLKKGYKIISDEFTEVGLPHHKMEKIL